MNNEEYLKKLYGVKEEVKAPKPVQSEGANNEEYLNNLFGVQTETPKVEEKKGPGLLSRAASTIANIGPAVFDTVTKFDPIEALGDVGKQTLEAARAQHSSVKATNKAIAPLLVPQKPTNEWSDPRDAGTQSKLGLVGGAITTTTPFQEGVGEALDMRPILNEAYRLWQAGDLDGMTRLASGNFIDLQGSSDTGLRRAIAAISSTEGGPIKAASELAKAVPFFGPMAEQVEVLLKEGQYAKAAGLSLGIIAPFGVHAIGGKIAFKPEKMAQAALDAHRIYAWDAKSLQVEEARIKKMPDGPEKTKAIEHLEVVRQGKMAAAVREAAIKLLDKEKSEAVNKRVRGERKKKAPEAAKPVEEKTVESPAKTPKKKRAAKAKTKEAKTETPETPIEEPVDTPLVTAKEIAKIKALTAQGLDPGQIAFKLDIAEAEIRKVIGEKKASDGTKIIQTEEPVSGGSDTIITPDELKAIEKHFGPDWDEIPTEQLDKWVEDLRKGEADTSEFTAKVVEVADDALDIEALQKEIDAELAGEKGSFRGAFKKDEGKIGEFDSEAALTEAEARLRKLRDEEIISERIVDEALEDVDIATGSKDPVMGPVDDVVSPFRTEKDVTTAQANNYRRSVLVAEDFTQLTDQSTPKSVLVTTHKLVNDINRVLDGDRTVNIQNTREFLSEVAARADEFEWEFIDESGVVDATAFNEWKQFTQSAASWARHAGNNRGQSLYSGVPLDKVGDVMQQWYSGLRDYANKKLGGKASGQQIKATLRKGSTADEWKQVQLDEMLEDGKSYSKAEVLAIIDENKMEFEDVVLSQDKAPKVIQTGPDSFRINTDDPVYGPNFFTREAAERRLHDVRRSRDYVDGEPKFSPYVEPGGKNYVELFVTAPEVKISPHTENLSKAQWIAEGSVGDWPRPSKTTWRDGHVDYDVIENPIVRLRMNDRVGPNGEKVLFIEELQGPNKDNQAMMPEALRKRIREIGMKRAIKYALDGGYDRVAWTTGEMQANRYSLDKHIDGISWTKYKNVKGDDVVDIAVSSKNGDYTDYIVKPEDLKNYIGEELANKVNSGETSGELTGLDLKFKEPGLRKLYDQDLPNVAKKLGGKVEDSKVNFALTQAELQIANRIHYYAVRDRLTGETYGPEFKSFEEADAYIKSGVWKERGLNEKTVQSFSVKPFEARKDVGFTFYSGVDPVAAYKSVMKYMDDARGVKDFKPKEALKMVKESFIRKIVDTSGNLREDFISVLGQDGYRMIQAMYLSKGAGSRSSKMYRQMEKEVFGGLNSKEQQLLDALILNDRLVAISKTPRGKGFKYPKGLELKKAQAFVENFEAAAGIAPERALTIRQRAQAYADWMRKPLKDLYESDIIGTKEFEDLLISNYRRIQLAEIFDRENPTLKGHKRSVYDSGVETLQKGKKSDIYEPSSRIVALEVFNRAYGRIANNNANLELLHLAKSNPSNPFARIREKGVESVTELEPTRRKILDSIMIKRDRLGMSDYEFRSMVKEKTKTSSLSRLNNEQLTQIEAELGDGHFKYNIKKLPDDQKIPKGWGTVYVYEGGVRRPIRVSPQLMKEWITSSPEISYKYAQMLRWASGSNVLRTFATGINWSFAVKNIPRDIMHIWFSARQMTGGKWTSTYSTLMPKFGVQMGTDLAGTFKDALTRGPKWVKFIDEGGGMEWLAHQGRLFQKGRHIEGWADKAYDFLGYFGETSEIWTRLALRDRVIKNRARELGISYQEAAKRPEISKEATFVARDYMDFSQGGSFTKAADAGIPYLNATIQGTRGLLRSFKRDTALQSTMKLAQLGALVTGIYIARRVMAPEAHQQLRGEIDDVNNLVIPLPESLAYEDEHGQKVYQYLKIPMDSGQKFFKAVFEASVDQWYGEEVDYNKIKNAFEALSPVGLSSLPPTINSAIVYLANKDLWTGRDVWRGEGGALPYPNSKEEYIPGRTPQAAIDLGQVTGVSPERGLAALQKLIPKNIWGTLLGAGYEWLADVPESQRQRTLSEALHNVPEWKSIIGVTNPYSQWANKISTERDKDRAERLRQNNEIDSLIRGNLIEGNVTSEEIDDRIFRYEDRKVRDRLKDRVKFAEKTYDLPNYSFWMSMRGLPVNVRAEVYTYRIKNSTPEQLAILDEEEAAVRRIEKRLKSSQFSIFTDEFKKEVRKLGY